MIRKFFVALYILTATFACNPSTEPQALEAGKDECEKCRMKIMDTRYGGEVISPRGKIAKFDSIDCLLGYLKDHGAQGSAVYVADYLRNGVLVRAEAASYVENQNHSAPMASRFISYEDKKDGLQPYPESPGPVLQWKDLQPPS